MLARADTNVQNLSGFGFAESFLDPGNSSDSSSSKQSSNSVLTFGNKNFGLGLNLQWEIDRMSSDGQDEYSKLIKVWNKVLKQYKAKGVK